MGIIKGDTRSLDYGLHYSVLHFCLAQVEREIQVQRTLKHENVLRLYKHFEAEMIYT